MIWSGQARSMLTTAIVLVILWLFGFFAFRVTTPLVHVLLAAAAACVVAGVLQRRRKTPRP